MPELITWSWIGILLPLGFLVGVLVGLTGVGGGALMTPTLILLGIPPIVAVGTDLIYAAITKCFAVVIHQVRANIRWNIVIWLALGSVPCAAITLIILKSWMTEGRSFDNVIVVVLGCALILTALISWARPSISRYRGMKSAHASGNPIITRLLIIISGVIIGLLVALSSVGAGALGAAALLLLYPKLPITNVVGTDLAHALILATVAGIGHWTLGSVNLSLLLILLAGSIPGVYLGSVCSGRISNEFMRRILISILFIVGVGFALSQLW